MHPAIYFFMLMPLEKQNIAPPSNGAFITDSGVRFITDNGNVLIAD